MATALLATAPLFATGSPADPEFRVALFTTNDGLPQNTVTSITQSEEGYLCLGTWLGMARYDGREFIRPVLDAPSRQGGSGINAFALDGRGGLWVGTTTGLQWFSNQTAQAVTEASIQESCLAVAAVGEEIMVGGQWGGAWGRPGALRQRRGDMWVHSAVVASDSSVWFAAREGLWRISTPLANHEPTVVIAGHSHSAVAVAGDTVWASVDSELLEIDAVTARVHRRWPGTHVQPWLGDRAGRLWVSQKSPDGRTLGLGTWDRTTGKVHPLAGVLLPRNEDVLCGFEDSSGTLWFGTRTSGLLRVGRVEAHVMDERHGLPSGDVWSISASADGGLWIQTKDGPARRVGDHFEATDWVPDEHVSHSILAISQRDALAAGRLLRRVHDRVVSDEAGPGPSIDFVVSDRGGHPVAGGSAGIWSKTGEGAWLPVPGLPKPCLWIGWEVGPSHEVFAGSLNHGLWNRMKDGPWQRVPLKGSPGAAAVLWWEDGRWPWVGSDSGLHRRGEDGQWDRWTTEEGLRENLVMAIEPDHAGRLLLLGHQGITRVAIDELKAVARRQAARVRSRLIAGSEGLTSTEGNSGFPSSTREADGRLWFATTRGAVWIRPADLPAADPPLPVIEEAHDISMGSDSRSILIFQPAVFVGGSGRAWRFRFNAPLPSAGHRVQVEYRLEGVDRSWRDAGRHREASYAGLKPGRYRFEVRAAADDGPWNTRVAHWDFEVRPMWRERADVRIAGAIAGMALTVGVFTRRLRLQRRLADLERAHAVEEERRRLARDLHDGLGSEIARINVAATTGSVDVGAVSRDLLRRLQTLVWLTDPAEDRLDSLCRSMASRVEHFFPRGLPVVRMDLPAAQDPRIMDGRWRRELTAWLDEALANVAKHAHAKEVRLGIQLTGDTLSVTLADDGVGFDPAHPRPGGRGLANLRSRIASLGGSMDLRSTPGVGTEIQAWVPLPNPRPSASTKGRA